MTGTSHQPMNTYRDQSFDELWDQDPALLHVLCLAPLLVVGNSTVTALGVGLATMLVTTLSALLVSLLRHQLTATLRLTLLLVIYATLATCVALLMQVH